MPLNLKPLFGAFEFLASAIAIVSAIAGLASGSLVVALNTFFLISLFPAVFVGALHDEVSPRTLAIIGGITIAISAALYFAVARPLDEGERQFNILTVGGIGMIVAAAVFIIVSWEEAQRGKRKTCPDCANQVLAEARKCQFCGYRFDRTAPADSP